MKAGFVILNYNSSALTQRLAEKICGFDCIDLLVIVDNASTDDSFQRLKQLENKKNIVISSGKNGGYSYGNNFGIKICSNEGMEVVFVSNPDVLVEEADLQKIIHQFELTDYSLLTAVQYEIDGRIGRPVIGYRHGYKDDLADCFRVSRKMFNRKKDVQISKTDDVCPINIFKGSFFAVRTADFWEAGGFDENVFLYCEERILSSRLENHGKKMGLVPDSRYDHMHAVSIKKAYRRKTDRFKILYRSRLYYNEHYLHISNIKRFLLITAMQFSLLEFRILDLINFVLFQIKGKEG